MTLPVIGNVKREDVAVERCKNSMEYAVEKICELWMLEEKDKVVPKYQQRKLMEILEMFYEHRKIEWTVERMVEEDSGNFMTPTMEKGMFDELKYQLGELSRKNNQLKAQNVELSKELKRIDEKAEFYNEQLHERNKMIDKVTESCYHELMTLKSVLNRPLPGNNEFRPQDYMLFAWGTALSTEFNQMLQREERKHEQVYHRLKRDFERERRLLSQKKEEELNLLKKKFLLLNRFEDECLQSGEVSPKQTPLVTHGNPLSSIVNMSKNNFRSETDELREKYKILERKFAYVSKMNVFLRKECLSEVKKKEKVLKELERISKEKDDVQDRLNQYSSSPVAPNDACEKEKEFLKLQLKRKMHQVRVLCMKLNELGMITQREYDRFLTSDAFGWEALRQSNKISQMELLPRMCKSLSNAMTQTTEISTQPKLKVKIPKFVKRELSSLKAQVILFKSCFKKNITNAEIIQARNAILEAQSDELSLDISHEGMQRYQNAFSYFVTKEKSPSSKVGVSIIHIGD